MENITYKREEESEILDLSHFLSVEIKEEETTRHKQAGPAVAETLGEPRVPQRGYTWGTPPTAGPRCITCNMDFATNEALMIHGQLHGLFFNLNESDTLLSCTCGRKFENGASLEEHKRNRYCYQCERCYFNPCRLRKHEVTHSGEKKFVCVNCQKEYKQNPSLQYHYSTNPICKAAKEHLNLTKVDLQPPKCIN